NRPILLADEATSSLDKDLSVQIHRTILQDFPGTVIEVAHKVTAEEQAMFDQVVNLNLK
ncbi:MAG: ABC transporter ATP-binding protein, partial [Lactobacillus sp.]|nr:ABC transporter ATP-binding protein [Lactobacillus sp.]